MLSMQKFVIFTVVLRFCGTNLTNGERMLPAGRLRSNLMTNYHTVVRPVIDVKNITNVSYGASLYELVAIDPKSQTINLILFQRIEWVDETMSWDPREHSGVDCLRFDRTEIWTPDILPYNDVGGFDEKQYDSIIQIMVRNDGSAYWFRPVNYATTCDLDVTNFPFDSQHCEVPIGSWQYMANELVMTCGDNNQVKLTPYLKDSLWSLESAECSTELTDGELGRYSTLKLSFSFKRLSSFYVKNLIVPHTLILYLSTLIFFIPGEVGEKIGFGITVTLTIVVNLSIVTGFLPQTSTSYPKLYRFYICSIVISGLSLVLSTISVNLAFPDQPGRTGSIRYFAEQNDHTNSANVQDEFTSRPRSGAVVDDGSVKFKLELSTIKRWISQQWRSKMTRRKIDMLIGIVYFMVVITYTIVFFSSLKSG